MSKEFNISQTIEVPVYGHPATYIHYRIICPDCLNHKQGAPDKVHDCKNLFVDNDGKTVGQCCCYSSEHGIRGDDD